MRGAPTGRAPRPTRRKWCAGLGGVGSAEVAEIGPRAAPLRARSFSVWVVELTLLACAVRAAACSVSGRSCLNLVIGAAVTPLPNLSGEAGAIVVLRLTRLLQRSERSEKQNSHRRHSKTRDVLTLDGTKAL
jgi:hypothetical protein